MRMLRVPDQPFHSVAVRRRGSLVCGIIALAAAVLVLIFGNGALKQFGGGEKRPPTETSDASLQHQREI
jgi:hypothetical protein